jgi:hypothetical protein
MSALTLELLPVRYAVCRLPAGWPAPAALLAPGPDLRVLARTPDELSLVCPEQDAPAEARVETGWRAFKVAGPLDFSLTGVLASLAAPLAAAGVSIFAVSTFDTDYLLVREASLAQARAALESAGHLCK